MRDEIIGMNTSISKQRNIANSYFHKITNNMKDAIIGLKSYLSGGYMHMIFIVSFTVRHKGRSYRLQ